MRLIGVARWRAGAAIPPAPPMTVDGMAVGFPYSVPPSVLRSYLGAKRVGAVPKKSQVQGTHRARTGPPWSLVSGSSTSLADHPCNLGLSITKPEAGWWLCFVTLCGPFRAARVADLHRGAGQRPPKPATQPAARSRLVSCPPRTHPFEYWSFGQPFQGRLPEQTERDGSRARTVLRP